MGRDQEARKNREEMTAKRINMLGWRFFQPWTRTELTFAQSKYERKIRFWKERTL
jgi:hypothetical protein